MCKKVARLLALLVLSACSQSTVDAGAFYDEISVDMAIDSWIASGREYPSWCEADRDELLIMAANDCEFVGGCGRLAYWRDPLLVISADPSLRRKTTIEAATAWLEACASR